MFAHFSCLPSHSIPPRLTNYKKGLNCAGTNPTYQSNTSHHYTQHIMRNHHHHYSILILL